MIIPSRKINFVHVPKAAGSTVGVLLNKQIKRNRSDVEFAERFQAYAKNRGYNFPNHTPAKMRLEFMGRETYSKFFSFAFVRNPFDLVVSLYEYTRQKEQAIFVKNNWTLSQFQKNILNNSFNDWVLNFDTGRPQHAYIFSDSGEMLVTHIGKTETFQKDFSFLAKALGIDAELSQQKHNSTARGNYRQYYSSESVAIIEKNYEKDLNLFGYSF